VSKAFADRYPSETFSRDPELLQPAIICGSGVSEGYLSAKADQGKTQFQCRRPLLHPDLCPQLKTQIIGNPTQIAGSTEIRQLRHPHALKPARVNLLKRRKVHIDIER